LALMCWNTGGRLSTCQRERDETIHRFRQGDGRNTRGDDITKACDSGEKSLRGTF
jgi:hypothetical protein